MRTMLAWVMVAALAACSPGAEEAWEVPDRIVIAAGPAIEWVVPQTIADTTPCTALTAVVRAVEPLSVYPLSSPLGRLMAIDVELVEVWSGDARVGDIVTVLNAPAHPDDALLPVLTAPSTFLVTLTYPFPDTTDVPEFYLWALYQVRGDIAENMRSDVPLDDRLVEVGMETLRAQAEAAEGTPCAISGG